MYCLRLRLFLPFTLIEDIRNVEIQNKEARHYLPYTSMGEGMVLSLVGVCRFV